MSDMGAERRGAEARRLSEEIEPYVDRIEKAAMEQLLVTKLHTEEGREEALAMQSRIFAVRSLKALLTAEITTGKSASQSAVRRTP